MRVSIHTEKVMKRGEKTYFWFTLNLKMRKLAKKEGRKVFFAGKREGKNRRKREKKREEREMIFSQMDEVILRDSNLPFLSIVIGVDHERISLSLSHSYSLTVTLFLFSLSEKKMKKRMEETEKEEKK